MVGDNRTSLQIGESIANENACRTRTQRYERAGRRINVIARRRRFI